MLGRLAQDLLRTPSAAIEPHPRVTIAFAELLHPQEGFGPYRLRAGVATPQAASQRGDEEQGQRGEQQQQGEQQQILRNQSQREQMKAAMRQVEEHQRLVVPAQPGQQVVEAEQRQHRQHAQVCIAALCL